MKITALETRLLAVDPRPRYLDGKIPPGRPLVWHYPLVTIHTDEGVSGHSMAYGPHGDGAALADILRHIYLPEVLGENPLHIEKIWQKIQRKQRHLYNQRDSLAGVIDVALWDIMGKVAGLPVAALLGQFTDRVPAYMSARSERYTADEIAREVCEAKASGFHGYKLQLRDGPATDIPRLRAAREAVGPGFRLMQDPNSAYTLTEAVEVGRVLDECAYHWFEEPIPESQIENYQHLTATLRTPILAAETVTLADIPNFIDRRAATILRGDVLLKGGITGLHKAMAACELFGLNLEIHTANTPLLDVANLHVACAARNTSFIEVHHPVFRFGLKNHPLDSIGADGLVRLPTGPGLGVELDWDWIENHTVTTTALPLSA